MRPAETQSAQTLIEPLTRRESQMLAFLAEGYSRPEIATRLTIGLTSVKFHIQNLYGKLGVNSKRQALSRAQALGLLAAPGGSALNSAEPGPAPRHNLPLQVTRFFGRETEITQLRDQLDEYRLVTLTGSGGVGKTRLSVRVAEEALTEFADGVWFVMLAPLAEPDLVVRQVVASLGLRDEPGRSSLETLTRFLRPRQALLVLDNCEHLRLACARLADALLRTCSAVKILTSSREPLGVDGEAVFRVPSLPFPDPALPVAAGGLDEFPSVRLFLDRARLVVSNYQLADHNAVPIASICQRLDGIPLALGLAAARVKLLTAEQVAARLDDSLGLLTGGSHTALPRHQTLQATLQWSFDLLAEPERRLLERLSVFAGGSTLAAAEAVCAGEGVAREHLLDTLTALVDKSLVTAERRANQDTRYRLLEMVRQFAAEKLSAAGDRPAVRTRHRDYFLAFVEDNVDKGNTADEVAWTAQLLADLDNVRLALDWSFQDDSRVDAGPRLVLAIIWYWPSVAELLEWSRRTVPYCETHPGIDPGLFAGVLGPSAHMLSHDDVGTAVAWGERAVTLCRPLGPSLALMIALAQLNWTYFDILGDVARGTAAAAEAEAIFQQLGAASFSPAAHITWAAHFAQFHGRLAFTRGQFQAAKAFAADSIRLYQQVGSPNATDPLMGLGEACLQLGEYDQAQDHFLDALGLTIELPTFWGLDRKNSALRWLGLTALKRGRLDEALAYAHDALTLAAELDNHIIAAGCLGLLAQLAVRAGDPPRAATLSGAAQALTAQQGRQPWIDSSLDTLLPGWQTSAGAPALAAGYAAGQALPADEAIAWALAAG